MEPITTKRPWGSFTRFTNNEKSTVKILDIKKGEELSLQYHMHREEFWRILKGSPTIVIGNHSFYPKIGENFTVKPHTNHRISAPNNDVEILEIAKGEFDENDIVRIDDKYHRSE